MGNAVEFIFDTVVLLALLAVFFLAIYAPFRAHRPIPYIGGLFLLNVLVAVVALVWGIHLREFIATATFNWGGLLFGLIFTGFGIYLLVVSLRDRSGIVVPIIIIATGLILAVVSFIG